MRAPLRAPKWTGKPMFGSDGRPRGHFLGNGQQLRVGVVPMPLNICKASAKAPSNLARRKLSLTPGRGRPGAATPAPGKYFFF